MQFQVLNFTDYWQGLCMLSVVYSRKPCGADSSENSHLNDKSRCASSFSTCVTTQRRCGAVYIVHSSILTGVSIGTPMQKHGKSRS